jgi:WD40 repeat protein
VARLDAGAPVRALAVRPDGSALLAGGEDARARLFDLPSGQLLRVLDAHRGPVRVVAFSPNGARMATAGAEGGVMLWEADTGRKVVAFAQGRAAAGRGPSPVGALTFLGPETLATAGADGGLKTWRVTGSWSSWRTLGPIADRALALDFDRFGGLLAVGAGAPTRSGEVTVWETGKGTLVRRLDRLHSDTVCGLAFSPDGSRLATASADRFLKVVEVATGVEGRSFEGHGHHVLAVAWSPDGKQLASGGADGLLKLWDAQTGEPGRSSQPLGTPITALRWSHLGSGRELIAGSCGDRTVRLWNPANLRVDHSLSAAGGFLDAVALSADRTRTASGGTEGVLYLWDSDSEALIRKFEP